MKFSKALIEPFKKIKRCLTSEGLIESFRKIRDFFTSEIAKTIYNIGGMILFIFVPPVSLGVGFHHLFDEPFAFVYGIMFTIFWVCYSLWVILEWIGD